MITVSLRPAAALAFALLALAGTAPWTVERSGYG